MSKTLKRCDLVKDHVCPYPGCTKAFNRPSRLAQHVLGHHDVRIFRCPEEGCSKGYSNKCHLDRHIRTVHKVPDNYIVYQCPTCMKRFTNRQNLKRHMKTVHIIKTSVFTCDFCKKECKKKHILLAHMYEHTGIKSFNCEQCPEVFISLRDKKRHQRYHKTYMCGVCSMVFNHWSKYLMHKRSEHTGKEFICDHCQRSFKKRTHLVRHMSNHAKITIDLFICPYEDCTREYTTKYNLKCHIKTKHQKETYDCHICLAKLASKSCLRNHIKKIHETERKPIIWKTKLTGRAERRDKGVSRTNTALQIVGLPTEILNMPKDISISITTETGSEVPVIAYDDPLSMIQQNALQINE